MFTVCKVCFWYFMVDVCVLTQELQKAIMEDMVRLGKESGLHSFEQVNGIYCGHTGIGLHTLNGDLLAFSVILHVRCG